MACEKLRCTRRTVERYRARYLSEGPQGLADRRRSHNQRVSKDIEEHIVSAKLEGKHRSARFIKDHLKLLVHRETVRRVLVCHHLSRITLPPVKPVERFEAPHPNALRQIDIMGKTHFPLAGDLYLVCAIDDRSRFIPYGQWFYRQYGINVYQVMYNAFIRYGLPEAILSDRGSQFKPTRQGGEANYQWYAHRLGIKLLYGRGLDARPGNMGGGAMEINTVPCFQSQDAQGVVYSKLPKLQFPVDEQGRTLLVQDVTYYSKAALYDAFKAWRDGGPAYSGRFDEKGAWMSTLTTRIPRFDQGGKKITGVDKIFNTKVFETNVWGLEWYDGTKNAMGNFPQYFKHVGEERVAVSVAEVPAETQLKAQEFKQAGRGEPYTSPTGGAWSKPGPVRGPYRINLADGSTVTYSWYRFVDQPSFQQYGWSEGKKAKLQAFVEKIHAHWSIDRDYMAPLRRGTLVTLDPALLVTPPEGLEVGYVPIVTRQEDSGVQPQRKGQNEKTE